MVRKALLTFFIVVALIFGHQATLQIVYSNAITVDFINIGQGDAALITTSGGRTFLIDAGNDDATSSGKDASIVSYLRNNNVAKIDVATVSHYDSDHSGGMRYVVYYFDVDLLILPTPKTDEEKNTHDDIIGCAKDSVRVVYANQSDHLTIGDNFRTDVLFYNKNASTENGRSLVLESTCFNDKFLFTGDIGVEEEADILSAIPHEFLKFDVAKVAHHGSKYSSSSEFYQVVQPIYAVISVGKNSYGHPTEDAMGRIAAVGTQILRTDQDGLIKFTINKDGLKRSVL